MRSFGKAVIQYFPACARVHSSYTAPKISVSGNLRTGSSLLTVDEPLHVTIGGLESRQRVTLRATLKSGGRNETTFQSFAHYEADSFGHVDLKEHVSQGGTYQGAEPMGLFWSMKPLKNDGITQSRFMPKGVNSPVRSHFELYDGFVNFGLKKYSDVVELRQTFHPIESKTIDRWYLDNERVARETVKTGRLRGEIFIPKSPGKFKGVIDLYGSAGGLIPGRATLLAMHGFATYSLPYFAYDDLPPNIDDVDIEYFEEAVEHFRQHSQVEKDSIGIIATSFGVPFALLLAARRNNRIKATVCINGPDCYVMHSFSVDGEKIEYIPFNISDGKISDDGSLITRDRLLSDEELYRYPNARIPIEQANGKILYLASGDDQNFNSERAARRMYKHLRECGKEETMDFVVYPKAGHLLDHPFMPFCKAAYHRICDTSLAFGGIAVNHSKAQEDAWRDILAFFKAM